MKKVVINKPKEDVVHLENVSENKIYALKYDGKILIAGKVDYETDNEWYCYILNDITRVNCNYPVLESLEELLAYWIDYGVDVYEFENVSSFGKWVSKNG